jgi:hypothetical protein
MHFMYGYTEGFPELDGLRSEEDLCNALMEYYMCLANLTQ